MNEQVAESVCQLATGVADLKLFSRAAEIND